MLIITGNSLPTLARNIAEKLSAPIIHANTKKFADQELRIQLDGQFNEQDVVIIQSTSNPANDHLLELLLIADTVKRAGAKRITAVIPYFGYSRQDRPSYNHGPISASLVATLIEAAGVDRVITLDLHSRQSEGFFKIGVQNLDSLPLFVPVLKDIDNAIIVSPDIGGVMRAQRLAEILNLELAVINKTRTDNGNCQMSEIIGGIKSKNCILIDDIIDTGNTLSLAAKLLHERGAKSVSACVTHAVFSDKCELKIASAGFDKFYITNSINHTNLSYPQTISITDLIATSLVRHCE